jgi:hypothetical protein
VRPWCCGRAFSRPSIPPPARIVQSLLKQAWHRRQVKEVRCRTISLISLRINPLPKSPLRRASMMLVTARLDQQRYRKMAR